MVRQGFSVSRETTWSLWCQNSLILPMITSLPSSSFRALQAVPAFVESQGRRQTWQSFNSFIVRVESWCFVYVWPVTKPVARPSDLCTCHQALILTCTIMLIQDGSPSRSVLPWFTSCTEHHVIMELKVVGGPSQKGFEKLKSIFIMMSVSLVTD